MYQIKQKDKSVILFSVIIRVLCSFYYTCDMYIQKLYIQRVYCKNINLIFTGLRRFHLDTKTYLLTPVTQEDSNGIQRRHYTVNYVYIGYPFSLIQMELIILILLKDQKQTIFVPARQLVRECVGGLIGHYSKLW
ncbi:Hypothetical_protein [Hexamita inflata]|uniref:Hypothetical_protein n=1 Tax=Hexamita inflata TaxID=28002 RepID=A0AA86UMB7_9EUKA|nr:Hypothetical protein HINF_LOCUS44611 [Hexamita inflata]